MKHFCPACGGECRVLGDTLTCYECERQHGVQELPAPPERHIGRKVLTATIALALLIGGVWFVGAVWTAAMRMHEDIHCAGNLRALYQSLRTYAEDHGGAFPPTLAALPEISPTNCTFDMPRRPPQIGYIYIGAGVNVATATPEHVIAYEPFPDHRSASVLHADGFVDSYRRDDLLALLNRMAVLREHNPDAPVKPEPQ